MTSVDSLPIIRSSEQAFSEIESMHSTSIQFCCPHCGARIKAAVHVAGKRRDCPGCSQALTVPRPTPPDSGPMLVLHEREDRLAFSVVDGGGRAVDVRPYRAFHLRQSA